ncbi:MAG: DegT/DnrJ/EryC1/StrS family aminotransferase [Massilibacteroides sp.]|nr:DegT/DnrJ/EryC1/StrS family aminotransferase [Massilibacteroides sp.]MDD3061288.1 DegT/DnrJ/EryC1/StrS family aminotransferase [Massilibacteroides sp.]MDD4114877.1 DegT/DnrJ/EryC1/StrS family aminotransferase [Massilibacteroides sp.]MDD4659785.1 DegT/DnrJ/EryC1/StrS family aminotransferase [Massilibacteroides sp.]
MKKISRRQFMTTASAVTLGVVATNNVSAFEKISSSANTLAIAGGTPVRQNKTWPKWPQADEKVIESVTKTTRSGIWCRIDSPNGTVPTFEKEYASLMGAKYCVATGSGTQSLHTCVEALGIGPGDEVITSPYTDMGTISGILSARALPVLADIDRESFQLDPKIVERLITPNTKAIIPVHIMGQPCDLDSIMAIAKKHNLYVIEDACQAHLAQFRGKRLGTIGDVGCFSHQSSKTIPCGEGGSIIGDNEELMDQCYTVMNHGTNKKGRSITIGPKYRMNEFEGAVLLAQLPKAIERWKRRNENAAYLTAKLKSCPGVVPQKLYDGTESGSFYLYTMGYRKEHFNNVDRAVFLKALAAEGINLSPYIANGLHRESWVDHILGLRVYQAMYSPARLKQYKEELQCPVCDKVCNEEMLMLWASGPLLGTKKDMDDIVDAIMKLYENKDQLSKVQL